MTAGRSPDAPTDRAGDGHRQMAAEVHRETAMEVMAWTPLTYDQFRAAATAGQHPDDLESLELVDAIAAALAAAEQRGRDETARKVLRLAVMYDRLADHEDMHSAACDAFHDAALDIRRALADRSEATP